MVYDTVTQIGYLVGDETNAKSGDISLSADGDSMIFVSSAALENGDVDGFADLYMVDDIDSAKSYRRLIVSETTDLYDGTIKVCPDFEGGAPQCGVWPTLSADGTRATFVSKMPLAGDLDRNLALDIYAINTTTAATALVSRRPDGTAPLSRSSATSTYGPTLRSDGAQAAFLTNAPDLVGAPYPVAFESLAPVLCTMPTP